MELIRFVAIHKPVVAAVRVSERIVMIIKGLMSSSMPAQDLVLLESMQLALENIVVALFDETNETGASNEEIQLTLCRIFEGLLQQLLTLKWTEPVLVEVLGHYFHALGLFLKVFPDAVGAVVNKLYELLTSLPVIVKDPSTNSARHARLQICTSFIRIARVADKSLLPHMKGIADMMAHLQNEGQLLRGEHNLLGEAFLIMASAAGIQQLVWLLEPLSKQWTQQEWQNAYLSDPFGFVGLCADTPMMWSLFHTVTFFERALKRSKIRKINLQNVSIENPPTHPMTPYLSWMLPPLLKNFWSKTESDEDHAGESVASILRPLPDMEGDTCVHNRNGGREFEPCSKLEDLNLEVGQNSEKRQEHIPIHEVIFSTPDKPKLLSQLSALLSDLGLNIREAHVFSTTDGYSLDVFVVDGWSIEDADSLHKAMEEAIIRSEGSWSGSMHSQFPVEIAPETQAEPGSWEIDRRLLKIGEKIASGSCGDLYRGLYLRQDVAIKVLKSEHLSEASEDEFAQEVAILRQVHHENVVRFIGACTKSPHLCIVTEYMPGGSLYNYLHRNNKNLKLSELLKFAIDVSKGMEYLHHSNIIHRDLKTANLLMDTLQTVKVADFGVARFLHQEGVMTAETGTYRWMAPEVINHHPYDQKADVFSFAIVLWELATAKVPYENMTPLQAALGVRQGLRPELPENTHPKVLNLMKRCWDTNPVNRPPFSVIRAELEELQLSVQETSSGTNSS